MGTRCFAHPTTRACGHLLASRSQAEKLLMARNVRMTHSEHLRDPEVAAEYLSEALEEGEPSVVLMALRNVADAQEGGIAGIAARSHLGRESM